MSCSTCRLGCSSRARLQGSILPTQELSPEEVRRAFDLAFPNLASEADLRVFEARFLGKDGAVRVGMRGVGTLPKEQRADAGRPWVTLEKELKARVSERRRLMRDSTLSMSLQDEYRDLTLPGLMTSLGASHPVTIIENECLEILRNFGFTLVEGLEVEDAYHNFDALNIPEYHPARQLQDTFWLANGGLLRSHTTTVQARVLSVKPDLPIKVASVGRVYRNEASDATHSSMFHQLEGFWLEEGLTLADLKGILREVISQLYGERKIRFKPKYYPYTEPSIGIDLSCTTCDGVGCAACHEAGWVTVMGAGMIHPNVLREFGYEESLTGIAFGWGTTRLASQWAGVRRVKDLYSVQQRVLRQIHGDYR